jgi:hypothetical protein
MNEFMALRAKARQRRDDEIAKARQDYADSLAKIAELEQRLLGKPDPKALELSSAVERVIPRDVADINQLASPVTLAWLLNQIVVLFNSQVRCYLNWIGRNGYYSTA